jgi:HAD superfamily hydrolase (TIGR01450 family)
MVQRASLRECADPLADIYDLAMLDLDGVVYIGGEAVPGAAAHLARAREHRMRLAFITNNASRTAAEVAGQLRDLGVQADDDDVVTSAQAAAHLLAERYGVGASVALLGGRGLEEALRAEGLVPVAVGEDAEALVSGFGPDVVWKEIMRAAVLLRDGLPWVASNTDLTFPSSFGVAPGHGVLVRMLSEFSGVTPEVAGKPGRHLLDETIRRAGGRRPLMVGDRLDTDIEGAVNLGCDSLLVMTGVTDLAQLVSATDAQRPSYLSADLGGLLEGHQRPRTTPEGTEVGGWRARVTPEGGIACEGSGSTSDWWRVVAVASWEWLDREGSVVDTGGLTPPERSGDDAGG